MFQIKEKDGIVIVREIPIIQRNISFGLFIILSFFIYIGFTSSANENLFNNFFCIIGMFVAALGSLLFLITNIATTVKIDKYGEILSVREQSVIKYSFKVYSFSEVAKPIFVDETKDFRGNKTYQIIISLKDGQKMALSTSIGINEGQLFGATELMNSYIFETPKQIPVKISLFNSD